MTIVNWITLLLGSGVFVLLLRLTFVLGQYSNRVDTMEETVREFKGELKEFRQKLGY